MFPFPEWNVQLHASVLADDDNVPSILLALIWCSVTLGVPYAEFYK